jgi:Xaa-Pro dipeptidase
MVGMDWQERINWNRMRAHRPARARAAMQRHGLGAMLLMYDENVRYVTSTLTPGWNRLKPGLRSGSARSPRRCSTRAATWSC